MSTTTPSLAGRWTVDDLPDDVLGLLLARAVQHGCEALAIMLVCKRWRDALLGLAYTARVTSDTKQDSLLLRCPGILQLTVHGVRLPWHAEDRGGFTVLAPAALSHLTKLTKLVLATPHWDVSLRDVAVLRGLRSFSSINYVIRSEEELHHLASLSALTELDMSNFTQPSGPLITTVLSQLSRLRALAALSLGPAPLIAGTRLEALSTLTALTRLQLSWHKIRFSDPPFLCDLSCLCHLKALAHLRLRHITKAYSPALSVLSSLTKLTHLALVWQYRTRTVMCGGLQGLQHMPNLQFLKLKINALPVPRHLEVLSTLTALTHLALKMARSPHGDDWFVPSCISTLTGLQTLIASWHVDDPGFVHLRPLTKLTRLELEDSAITEAGLPHIAALTSLRSLNLGDTGGTFRESDPRFGDEVWPHLATLGGSLEHLVLTATHGTDMGCLLGLSRLWSFVLSWAGPHEDVPGSDASLDTGAACLSSLASLQFCKICFANLSVTFCVALGALPRLESLTLWCCQFGVGVVDELPPSLTALCLDECAFTERAIEHVSVLQRLQNLGVRFSHCFNAISDIEYDVDEVAQCLLRVMPTLQQLTRVELSGVQLPDAAVAPLGQLPALLSLKVNGLPRPDLMTVWSQARCTT